MVKKCVLQLNLNINSEMATAASFGRVPEHGQKQCGEYKVAILNQVG
jgi:S-ribosylhomocysteine lyase LuxS involved in autoinducer biosynthesis